MRLHGRRAICAYLGRSGYNKNAWRLIRARYGELIYCDPATGHCWALSEELNQADKRRCLTMIEMLASRVEKGAAVAGAVGGYPRDAIETVMRITGHGGRRR